MKNISVEDCILAGIIVGTILGIILNTIVNIIRKFRQ